MAVKLILLFQLPLLLLLIRHGTSNFIEEATIDEIHMAFKENNLTSRRLVEFYLERIQTLNPQLRAVLELNPQALSQADQADKMRQAMGGSSSGLQGIPILIKGNIATAARMNTTADGMNTTAGSLAMVGSVVPRDAGVVERLRRAGAVILGKASLSEWAQFRSVTAPSGWCAISGQGKNPFVLSADPCGSSSGSAIAVAANLVMVSLGTETDGSILCPSSANSLVGIKPTLGLTSRSGVIPISPRQDTVGPICRTVSDAVHVLDAIVGFDSRDAEATRNAEEFIPPGGYRNFLKSNGLEGKRLGILKNFFDFSNETVRNKTFEEHFGTLRQRGAILVDNLEIRNETTIMNPSASGEITALLAEFKLYLNVYLSELVRSPVRSLADIIAFNKNHSAQEKIDEFGQEIFLASELTNGFGEAEKLAVENMERLSKDGIEKLMKEKNLDAIITPEARASPVFAIGGYPGISVPAGYGKDGVPFGICFGGLKGSEPKLIEIAYAFEQATRIRTQPTFKP
ncbi:probable amidase At4g34880 [Aristolochia californica]|uniref:probable amidase At4g34880 n=1 Tax=Aristolochia californica TaxID=171875 RepID=UPI0035DC33CB